MDDAAADRLEQLVAETGWLRRLARSLVADASTAHDAFPAAAESTLTTGPVPYSQ